MKYDMEEERAIEQRIMYLEQKMAQKYKEYEELKSECRQLEYEQQRKYTMT